MTTQKENLLKELRSNRKQKPKRNMRSVLQSMTQVLRVEHVADTEAIWSWGQASLSSMPKVLRVGVWNLWKGAGGAAFANEFSHITETVDLLLAQEALLSHELIKLFAIAGFEVTHASTYRRLDGCRDGVMTLSRTPAISAERIISATPEPLFRTTKAALITHHPIGRGNATLAVVNIHSTLIRRPKTAVEEMRRVMERLELHDGPVLFAGDFNTFNQRYLREMAGALALLGILHQPIPNDPRTRFARLDQIFTRGILTRNMRVDHHIKHSDHFPILAEFEVGVD